MSRHNSITGDLPTLPTSSQQQIDRNHPPLLYEATERMHEKYNADARILNILTHNPDDYGNEVVVNISHLPEGTEEGDVAELTTVNQTPVQRTLFIVKSPPKSFFRDAKWSNVQISFAPSYWQNTIDLPNRGKVSVRLREKSEVTADSVELSFKDAYLTRADMWRISSSLVGKCCFRTQRISYYDCVRATIFGIYRNGKKVKSAYISVDTRIVYRSESARMVYFIQISAEMWHFEESGQVIFHKMINSFLPEVFKRWHEDNAHHVVTIILFTSVDVSSGDKELGHGEVATETRDYFRVVVDQVHISKWSAIMKKLRHEFSTFDKNVLLQENGSIKGRILPAIKGNLLQAISIASTLVSSKFIDRDLRRTGVQTLIITPGAGIFDVDYDLLYQTSLNLLSIEIGIDLVCLSRAPLHVTPLFRYKNEKNEVKHCVPSWLDISFWSSTDRYTNQWIPRCKIYEIQMMGVMENEESSMSIDYLPDRLQCAESPDKEMDKYDKDLFSAPEFSSMTKRKVDDSAHKQESMLDSPGSTMLQKLQRIETGNSDKIPNLRQSPRSVSDNSAGYKNSMFEHSPYSTIRKGTGISLLAPEMRHFNNTSSKLAKSSATTEVDLSQASISSTINSKPAIGQIHDNRESNSDVPSILVPVAKVIRKTLSFSRKASMSSLRADSIHSSSDLNNEETLRHDGYSTASRRLIEMFPGVAPKPPPSLEPKLDLKLKALHESDSPVHGTSSLAVSISNRNNSTSININANPNADLFLENLESNFNHIDSNLQRPHGSKYYHAISPPSQGSSSSSLRNMGNNRRLSESTSPISNLKKKDHDSKNTRYFEERHSMWMTIPNPSLCTNSNIANITNYGRWQYVYPKGVKRRTVKWRSLKSPASLPLITPVSPSANQYKDYTFKFYGVTLERETSEYDSVYKLLHEMVAVRLAMGFQIMSRNKVKHLEPPRSPLKIVEIIPEDPVGCRIYMSMGTVIHRLTCEGEDKSNDITVHTHTNFELQFLKPRPGIAKESNTQESQTKSLTGIFVKTRYQKTFTPLDFDFFSSNVPVFNWNQVDQVLTGYEDQVFNDPRMYRIRLVLVPVNISGKSTTNHDTPDKLTIEEYRLEGLKVLLTQLQRGIYDKSGKRETLREAKKNIPLVEYYTGDFDNFLLKMKENHEIDGFQKDSLFIKPNDRFDQQSIKLPQLAIEIQAPTTGVKLVDRTWHLRVHKRCFIGHEFVTWLLKNFKDIKKPNDAVIYGNLLMKQGLFHHVENRHTFLNGHYFYQLGTEYMIPQEAEKEKPAWFGQKRQQSTDNSNALTAYTGRPEESNNTPGTNNLGSSMMLRTQSMTSIINFKRSHQRKHSANNNIPENGKGSVPLSPKMAVQDSAVAGQGLSLNESPKSILSVSSQLENCFVKKKLPIILVSNSMKYNVDSKQRSNRPENLTVHFDRVHNPENCYQLRFEWLNTTPKLVDEAIITLGKETEHYGLKLVQVPIQEISKLPDGNPFTSLYRTRLCLNPIDFVNSLASAGISNNIPLPSPTSESSGISVEEHPLYYHKYVIKSLGYVLDIGPISPEVSACLDVRYSWGKPFYENEQYVHKSGLSIVQIMGDGEIVFMTNFLADSRMGSFSGTTTTTTATLANAIGKPGTVPPMLASQSPLLRGESSSLTPNMTPEVLRKELKELCRNGDKLASLYLRAHEAWITKGRSEVNENLVLAASGLNSRPSSTSSTPRLSSLG